MSTRTVLLGAAMLALSSLAGCASNSAHTDPGFGDSVRASAAAQILNPGAARNTAVPSGIDAHAAQAAQVRYEALFLSPPPAERAMTNGSGK